MLSYVAVVSLSLTLAVAHAGPVTGSSYVAAVYEHKLVLNPDPRVPVSRSAALEHMKKNLDIYEEQAAQAAQQVWSEHDLLKFGFSGKKTVQHETYVSYKMF